jgi:Tfx family DNA-binding protein
MIIATTRTPIVDMPFFGKIKGIVARRGNEKPRLITWTQRYIVALNPKTRSILPAKLGLFTRMQFLILKHRANGLSQSETALRIGTTRANVSMIEMRARRKLKRAHETLRAYESLLSEHSVVVESGTRLHDVPNYVLGEGDKYGIHLRSNLVDIIRMARSADPGSAKEGRLTKKMKFVFAQNGIVYINKKLEKYSKP